MLTRVLSNRNGEANFNDIFSIFRDIMELISSNRFLDEAEIYRINVLCTDFGAKFPIYFPNRNIIRKIHELVFTVPNFHTLGLLSEQEGESKHAAINAQLRSLSSV